MDKIYNKRILKKLLLIRIIEEEISTRYKKQLMRCPIHLSIGQESCAVGVCENLKLEDIIFSNHRSHAHYIAKGCSIEKMIDEIHGKESGCIGGRGGSMHLQDIKKGFFGGFPIVGSSIGLATGTAFASKRKNLKIVTSVFFGDGAMEEGIIHESLNFASLFKLPIIYICENNFFSIFTHIKDRQTSSNFTRFAKAHNIKSLRINGNKLDNVLISFKKIVKYVRQTSKPFFLQLDTYRYLEHCGPNSDDYHNYRKKNELNFWLNLDPIKYYENKLKKKKIINDIEIVKIKKNIKKKVELIFNKSEKATFPIPNSAKKMFLKNKKNKFFTVWEAIRKTLIHCMNKDKNIILFGEGIDDGAAMFQTTKGFLKLFGAKRVFEMPLSENLFIGAAVGASMLGDKVIINLQRVEFALLALEQIINNAAKTHYLSNGSLNIPIVIRLVVGRGWGQGPTHSQSLETLFTSIPGLKVMMPVFPEESKNLLFEAIRDPNPVIFIENRWCHYNFGKLNKKYKSKNSSVIKLSEGNDLIIFTTGYNTNETVEILKMLKKYRINISHFHFGILKPLKIRNLISKIKKIKKIILLDSGYKEFGFFSEVVSQIYENIEGRGIKHIRIGLPDHPIPSSKSLTKNVYLTGDIILKNIFKILKLKKAKQKIIIEDYKNLIKNKIIDTPNNNFKGPF